MCVGGGGECAPRPHLSAYRTTTTQSGNVYGDSEPAPAMEAAVATLSTGPVANSDRLDLINKTLLMRCCSTSGQILKPDRPATALDSTFARRAFGVAGPDGELWASSTSLSGHVWDHVISPRLDADYEVQAAELDSSGDPATSRVLYSNDDVTKFAPFSTLKVTKHEKTALQLWHTAPVLSSGFALLGETGKWVPVSSRRFSHLDTTANGFSVQLNGAVGEKVDVAIAMPTSPARTQLVSCVLGASGNALLSVPQMTCRGE